MKQLINSPVSITAFSFGRDMTTLPRRMEWRGKTYHFIDQGLRVTVKRGYSVTNIITISDGEKNFCLRQSGSAWTLVSVD